jgi:hypothetical protein
VGRWSVSKWATKIILHYVRGRGGDAPKHVFYAAGGPDEDKLYFWALGRERGGGRQKIRQKTEAGYFVHPKKEEKIKTILFSEVLLAILEDKKISIRYTNTKVETV